MFRIEGEGFCSTTGHDRSSFIIRPISCFVLFYWERRSIIHSFIIFQLWLLLKPSLIFQIEVHESFLAFAWITTRTKPKWRGRKEERTRLLNEWAPNVVMKWIDPTISSYNCVPASFLSDLWLPAMVCFSEDDQVSPVYLQAGLGANQSFRH